MLFCLVFSSSLYLLICFQMFSLIPLSYSGLSWISARLLFSFSHKYFYPPEDSDDHRFDEGNEHELVEDVDAQTLIKLVKFLKRGKAPGPNTIHNEVLGLDTTTSFHHLAKLFTSSIQLKSVKK